MRGIAKRFGHVEALHPVDLDVPAGEFLSLLRPVRLGKDDAPQHPGRGYLTPSAGSLSIGGRDITRRSPHASATSAWCSRTTPCSRT